MKILRRIPRLALPLIDCDDTGRDGISSSMVEPARTGVGARSGTVMSAISIGGTGMRCSAGERVWVEAVDMFIGDVGSSGGESSMSDTGSVSGAGVSAGEGIGSVSRAAAVLGTAVGGGTETDGGGGSEAGALGGEDTSDWTGWEESTETTTALTLGWESGLGESGVDLSVRGLNRCEVLR
jgi:hypothetical protein